MATNKKSFLLYCDIIYTVKKLSNDQAGELFKTILSYVNDENPQTPDLIIDLVFEPIKQQLKRDLRVYEARCERNRENGQKGGRPKTETNQTEPKKPTGILSNHVEPKKPDNDIDIDNDNDIDIDNEINKRYKKLPFEISIPENATPLEPDEYKHFNCDNEKDIKYNEKNNCIEYKDLIFDFKWFWEMYNYNRDKDKCNALWNGLTKDEMITCFVRTPVYLETITDRKFLTTPFNYLKERRFMIDYRCFLDPHKYDLKTGKRRGIQ
jgi:hypothetical protein